MGLKVMEPMQSSSSVIDDYLILCRFDALSTHIVMDIQESIVAAERKLRSLREKYDKLGNRVHGTL
jgi:hypothetical protein